MSGRYKPLIELFDTAVQHTNWPSVTLLFRDTHRFYISRTGGKARIGEGLLTIRDQQEWNDSVTYGHIDRDGELHLKKQYGSKYMAGVYATDQLAMTDMLAAFADNPAEFARMQGQHEGSCIFCSRVLTHPDSLACGYGPVCAANYGLPHAGMAMARGRLADDDSDAIEEALTVGNSAHLRIDEPTTERFIPARDDGTVCVTISAPNGTVLEQLYVKLRDVGMTSVATGRWIVDALETNTQFETEE